MKNTWKFALPIVVAVALLAAGGQARSEETASKSTVVGADRRAASEPAATSQAPAARSSASTGDAKSTPPSAARRSAKTQATTTAPASASVPTTAPETATEAAPAPKRSQSANASSRNQRSSSNNPRASSQKSSASSKPGPGQKPVSYVNSSRTQADQKVMQAEEAFNRQDFAQAIALLEDIKFSDVSPDNQWGFFYLKGAANKRGGKPIVTCASYFALMKSHSNQFNQDTNAYLDLSMTLTQCGQGLYAKNAAEIVINNTQDSASLTEAYFWRGKSQMILHDFQGAAESFQTAADHDKSGMWKQTAMYEKANALAAAGATDEALGLYSNLQRSVKDRKMLDQIEKRMGEVQRGEYPPKIEPRKDQPPPMAQQNQPQEQPTDESAVSPVDDNSREATPDEWSDDAADHADEEEAPPPTEDGYGQWESYDPSSHR